MSQKWILKTIAVNKVTNRWRNHNKKTTKISEVNEIIELYQLLITNKLRVKDMRKLDKHLCERFLGNRSLTCVRFYIRTENAISYLCTDHPTAYQVPEVINSTTWWWGSPTIRVFVWTHKMVNYWILLKHRIFTFLAE